jgi:hypothetical protein
MTNRNINSNLGFLFEHQGQQIVYADTIADSFSGTFTGSLSGNFIGTSIANGTFTGSALGTLSGTLSGNFLGIANGTFTGSALGIFSGSATGSFTGSLRGAFSGTASGSFTGSFKGYVSGTLLFVPVTFSAAIHGVPVTSSSPSPFNGPPIGFIPYSAFKNNLTPITIENYEFSRSLSLNNYYVTINYDLEHTKPFLYIGKNGSQAMSNGVSTQITWEVLFGIAGGSGSTIANGTIYVPAANSGTIKVAEAGLYEFRFQSCITANATRI